MSRHELVRAMQAEKERDALKTANVKLRKALRLFAAGAVVFYEDEQGDTVVSMGRWKYNPDGTARFYADSRVTVADIRHAYALTRGES